MDDDDLAILQMWFQALNVPDDCPTTSGDLSYYGPAGDGEVEDYVVYIICSNCGDFDDNGSIDINDLRTLAANWLWTGAPGGNNIADLNCDGKIDYEDFAIFALLWLGSCP